MESNHTFQDYVIGGLQESNVLVAVKCMKVLYKHDPIIKYQVRREKRSGEG